MKKIMALFLILSMLCPMAALSANDVTVQINGTPVEFDVPAQIISDRTMVPMRKIFETFSATVEWMEQSQRIVSTRGPLVIVMQINNSSMSVANVLTGETKTITLDVAPSIVTIPGTFGGRTLVPLRAISESLGMKVDWDDATRTVSITE